MARDVVDELLDLTASEQGYGGAMYAYVEDGGGCGVTLCCTIVLCCHLCWSPEESG